MCVRLYASVCVYLNHEYECVRACNLHVGLLNYIIKDYEKVIFTRNI